MGYKSSMDKYRQAYATLGRIQAEAPVPPVRGSPKGGCGSACVAYLQAPSAAVRLVRFRVTVAIQAFYLTFLFFWMGSGATSVYTPAFYASHVALTALSVMVCVYHTQAPLRTTPATRTALYWLIGIAVVSYILSAVHLGVFVIPGLVHCSSTGTGSISICTHNYVFTTYIFAVYNPVLLVLLIQAISFATCG